MEPTSQAAEFGLERGDIPISSYDASSGKVGRIPYDEFLTKAKTTRPVTFHIIRMPILKDGNNDNGVSVSSSGSTSALGDLKQSADAEQENVANNKSAEEGGAAGGNTKAAAVVVPPPSNLTALLSMSNQQLHEECERNNIKVNKRRATKDAMLEKLGVPTTKWHSYRKMKGVELKEELKKQNKTISGRKDQLLERLGVPVGFGETKVETLERESKDRERVAKKQKREQEKQAATIAASWVEATDPSSGEHYYYNENTGESTWDKPAGFVRHEEEEEEEDTSSTSPSSSAPSVDESASSSTNYVAALPALPPANNAPGHAAFQALSHIPPEQLALFAAMQSQMQQNLANESTYEDPEHENFVADCCDNPDFSNKRAAGAMYHADGSITEVWRCSSCHEIPERPNAKVPIKEFSSDNEDDEEQRGILGVAQNITNPHECVIQ